MRLVCDFHIHSRHSRATSKDLTIPNLEKYARMKGVSILGTGDFQHPKWNAEIKEQLTQGDDGLLRTKEGYPFVLQTEISLVYTQDGRGRRIHNLVLAPSIEVADQIAEALGKRGRLDYDGRPIFKIPCPEFVEMLRNISHDIEVIPAHAWTPWFSLFGSMSGFDSIKDCFQDQTKHIHAIETGLSCYDPDTEVLTEHGWKGIAEVTKYDKVCTLAYLTGRIEFQHPSRTFKYKYEGKMYRLKTKRVDLFVTPNHRLLYSPCDFRNPKPYSLREARSLFGKSKRFKKDGIWNGDKPKHFVLPAVQIKRGSRFYSGLRRKPARRMPIKPWLKFFGFWVAEGWVTEGERGDYAVCVCNTNKELLHEMKQILEYLGYNPHMHGYVLRVRDFQLFNYLRQFGKSRAKYVPAEIKSLSKDLLQVFLSYYIKGDGHIYGRTRRGLSATTVSKLLRDDLQEIALKVGMSAYYKLKLKKGTPFKSPGQKGKIYYQNEDSWDVYFIRKNQPIILPSSVKKHGYVEKWQEYKGYVYCVSVPNQVIYIRRNAIPLWCGNSDPEMNWRLSQLDNINLVSFSDLHSHWPWRIGREATILELNKPSYSTIVNAFRTGDGLSSTIEFFPEEGKYHVDGHRNCNIMWNPSETRANKGICPKCKSSVTVGVLNRVEQLADRAEGDKPKHAKPFIKLIPLSELISHAIGSPVASKKTWAEYAKLINLFGDEFSIMLDAAPEKLKASTSPEISKLILEVREQKIKFRPGYDGVYGEPLFHKPTHPAADEVSERSAQAEPAPASSKPTHEEERERQRPQPEPPDLPQRPVAAKRARTTRGSTQTDLDSW